MRLGLRLPSKGRRKGKVGVHIYTRPSGDWLGLVEEGLARKDKEQGYCTMHLADITDASSLLWLR